MSDALLCINEVLISLNCERRRRNTTSRRQKMDKGVYKYLTFGSGRLMKTLFAIAAQAVNDHGLFRMVPVYLHERVLGHVEHDPSTPDYTKVSLVVQFLEEQEARRQFMRPFLRDKVQWHSFGAGGEQTGFERDKRFNILQIHPAPMVKKALSEKAIEKALTRWDDLCQSSMLWLFEYDVEVGRRATTRLIVMLCCCRRKLYGVYHECPGDWTSFVNSGSEVRFTYCYSLSHLVEYLLTEEDMDIILTTDDPEQKRLRYHRPWEQSSDGEASE